VIVIRHTNECAGKPNAQGRLTGKCNCKTAKLDERARKQLVSFLGGLADDSIKAGEDAEYFALRLDVLAEQVRKSAHGVRMTAKRSNRTTRRTTHHEPPTSGTRRSVGGQSLEPPHTDRSRRRVA
jgi:hypothetical protein